MGKLLRTLWLPAAAMLLVVGWLWLDRLVGWHGLRQPVLGGVLLAIVPSGLIRSL